METAGSRTDRLLIVVLSLGYILAQLTGGELAKHALGVLALLVILKFLPQLRGTTLYLTAAFLLLGSFILFRTGASVSTWLKVASLNVTLVTLFVFSPLFGIPVRSNRYVEALTDVYRHRVKGKISFFLGTQLLVHLLGVILNIGAVPVVYQLASVNPNVQSKRLLATALLRGFAISIYWSPYFAAMALITSQLEVSWARLLPYALGFVMISFLVSFLIELPTLRGAAGTAAVHAPRAKAAVPASLWPLGFYLASAIVAVLLLEKIFPVPIVIIICFVAVVYPLIWCLATRSLETYRQGFDHHFATAVPALKKELVLFLAAGFFSGAIGEARLGEYVLKFLSLIPGELSAWFSVLTLLGISAGSVIGLHPIILVTILVTGINPSAVGISPLFFALLLLGSWGISNTVSPATAVNNLLANFLKTDLMELSIKWNFAYAAVLIVLLPVFLFLCGV